jgi:hypothetical protein
MLNRFQGAFLGSALGEMIGRQGRSDVTISPLTESIPSPLVNPPAQHSVGFGHLIVAVAETLIEFGTIDQHQWYQFAAQGGKDVDKIAATLPLMLFFHETELKRQLQLQDAAQSLAVSDHFHFGVLATGYAIAQALKEKLNPTTLIPKTTAYLQQLHFTAGASSLIQQLEAVQTLLEQRAGLEIAVKKLKQFPESQPTYLSIAIAFYCLLSTPEDWQLSVLRAAAAGTHPALTCTLTGILSGAYNSVAGIPRKADPLLNELTSNYNPWETFWGVKSVTEILHLAARLFAAWSGIYNLSESWPTGSRSAIAAPHVLRPR